MCVCSVTHLCPTLSSRLGSSIHGLSQARILEWVTVFSPPGDFPNPGIEPALTGRFFTTEPRGKPQQYVNLTYFLSYYAQLITISPFWLARGPTVHCSFIDTQSVFTCWFQLMDKDVPRTKNPWTFSEDIIFLNC